MNESKVGFSSSAKILVIMSVVFLTVLYAVYEKRRFAHFENLEEVPVLKSIPEANLELLNGGSLNLAELGSPGAMVHFWGTWCAPCETELPSFLRLAQQYQAKNLKFILIAVNDQKSAVEKYVKKYSLPSNVIIGLDADSKIMDMFGTKKVPETYLFGPKGNNLKKFTGPQEWDDISYRSRINFYLSLD